VYVYADGCVVVVVEPDFSITWVLATGVSRGSVVIARMGKIEFESFVCARVYTGMCVCVCW